MRLELTKRADYGIRAAVALAAAAPGDRISVRRIAEEQAIPARFLTQVMVDLVGAGLVDGRQGRTGGYRLARPASELTILDVIEAIEGSSRRRTCVLRGGPCNVAGMCEVHSVFAAAQDGLLEVLGGTSLATVVAGRRDPLDLARRSA
jgi:Rrf2 family protein